MILQLERRRKWCWADAQTNTRLCQPAERKALGAQCTTWAVRHLSFSDNHHCQERRTSIIRGTLTGLAMCFYGGFGILRHFSGVVVVKKILGRLLDSIVKR